MISKKNKIQIVTFTWAPLEEATGENELWVLLLKTNVLRGEFWQNITGSVEQNETYQQAAEREFKEETNLTPLTLQPLNYTFDYRDQKQFFIHEECFVATLQDKLSPRLDPHEHDEYRWELSRHINAKTYRYLSNYQTFLKAVLHVERY